MEIIQARGFQPSLNSQLSRFSAWRQFNTCCNLPYSIFPVKPIASSSRTKLVSTRSTNSDSVATKAVGVDQLLAIKKNASEVDLKGTSIFFVGMQSSYKSSLATTLAEALRYYYFDSDSLVEEAAGGRTNVLSIIEKDEEGYRTSETEVLKQLSSMGRLVVCAGNGAVKSSTNLALLRHGITIWVDVPIDVVAREIMEDKIQLSASDASQCESSSEVLDQLTKVYLNARDGYLTADVTISIQKVASKLGYEELDAVTTEDLCLEVLTEIEKLVRVKKMMEEAARPF